MITVIRIQTDRFTGRREFVVAACAADDANAKAMRNCYMGDTLEEVKAACQEWNVRRACMMLPTLRFECGSARW